MIGGRWNTSGVTNPYSSLPNLSETNLKSLKFRLLDRPDSQVRHLDLVESVMYHCKDHLTSSSYHLTKFGARHCHGKPSPKNHSTRHALNRDHFFRWILHPQDHQHGSRSLRGAGSGDIVRLSALTGGAPSVIYVDAALWEEQQPTCHVRRTITIWSRHRNHSSTTKINHQTWISNTSSMSMLIFKARFHPFHRILAFWYECLSAFVAFDTCHCCITHMAYIDQKLRHMPETRKIVSRHEPWIYKEIFDDIRKL